MKIDCLKESGLCTHLSSSLAGCSSGTNWCSDFADEHPNVEVIGTDLSPIQPSWVPPNVKFELEDATKDWSWPENHFDLVHVRFLMGAIVDWGTLFKEASHCCKPGGFVESGEINPTFYSDDGSIDDVEALQTWNRLVIESGKGFGRSFTNIENDIQLFRDAGLVDVQSFDFKVQHPLDVRQGCKLIVCRFPLADGPKTRKCERSASSSVLR
jgi:hypothetical protein